MKANKKLLALLLSLVLLLGCIPLSALAQMEGGLSGAEIADMLEIEHEDNILLVSLKKEYSSNEEEYDTDDFEEIAVESVEDISRIESQEVFEKVKDEYQTILEIEISEDADIAAAIREISQRKDVEAVDLDYTYKVDAIPNDTYYSMQWNLTQISMPEAWDITTGSSSVKVGIIDSGIDYSHPDLSENMYRNDKEIPNNGIDDDGNGFIDDYYGYDFYEYKGDPKDVEFHGTACASVIGAVGNNMQGVSGVNWDVSLVALKAGYLNSEGQLLIRISAAIRAINYANDNSIPILSCSYGSYDAVNTAEYNAIKNYYGLFVASAGNDGTDNNTKPRYPGAHDLDNIISVAASDHSGNLPDWSNFGATSVDLAAPGSGAPMVLFPPYSDVDYTFSGTSAACPHVAGAAALLLSHDDTLTTAELKEALLGGVDQNSTLDGKCVTGGRLNVYKALTNISPQLPYDINGDGEITLEDLSLIIYNYYMVSEGNTKWDNAKAFDTDGNGRIGLLDIMIISTYIDF